MNSAPASSDLLYFTEHGSGPPLLLVHGLMVTGGMFASVLEPLARRHRVIVPDLRGTWPSRQVVHHPGLPGVHDEHNSHAEAVERLGSAVVYGDLRCPQIPEDAVVSGLRLC